MIWVSSIEKWLTWSWSIFGSTIKNNPFLYLFMGLVHIEQKLKKPKDETAYPSLGIILNNEQLPRYQPSTKIHLSRYRWVSCKIPKLIINWLVLYLPLWKIWVRQLGWWTSQFWWKNNRSSSHHQPVHIYVYIYIIHTLSIHYPYIIHRPIDYLYTMHYPY